ncbi:MAG: HD domain-containing protein [Patescibacteria group bacterium]
MLEKMTFLSAAENRESFFKRISLFLVPSDPRYQAIKRAYNCAKDAFRDIYREDGDRYFEHLRAVALILIVYLRVKDHCLIVAALLHDIVEDIPSWTIERVRDEFGDKVAFYVDLMTKPDIKDFSSKEEVDKVYHTRFSFAPREFFLLKLSDRLHNLITLWACTPEKRARKIEETITYYLPYAEKHFILLHELEEALALLKNNELTT